MYSDRDSYIRRRKQRALMRRKMQQRKIILSCGVIIAATIIVVAATTGAPKKQPTVPVESIPQSITQEESRTPYVATSTPTIESPSSTPVESIPQSMPQEEVQSSDVTTSTSYVMTSTPAIAPIETLPPDIPTAEVFNIKLSESLQVVTFETCIGYDIEDYYTLVLALMWVESRYDISAISRTNDYGLMQINKSNHEWLSEDLGISNFLDAEQNIKAGVYVLSNYLLKYEDVHKALMAYNMGARGASKHWNRGVYTSAYSRKIVATWDELKKTGTITE